MPARLLILLRRKNIHFNIDISSNTRDLWFDSNIIDKIFFNLLSNAFKFTPVGGTITVQLLDNLAGSAIDKSLELSDHVFTGFVVKDTGIGIPEEKMNAIFKRFEQLKSGKDMGVGTGIGLAIVKRLVDIHKGHIEVKSTLGSGSSFTIWFPANRESYDVSEIRQHSTDPHEKATDSNNFSNKSEMTPELFLESDLEEKTESSKAIKSISR